MATLKSLMAEYAVCDAAGRELRAQLKPQDDRKKQIADQLLQMLLDKGKQSHRADGLVATIEHKAATIAWAKLYLEQNGADAVAQLKADAGTSLVLKVTEA